jgi:ABC-type transport system involved in cytochrome bd biosynthesis fused ATPase/permease subunit
MIPMAAFESVSNFPAAALALSRVKGSATRIIEVMDSQVRVQEPIRSIDLDSVDLDLVNVSASWLDPTQAAINNISFNLPSGSSIGLVGPSGSGKSTIIAVLLKFLSPTDGRYQVGGIDTTKLTGEQIRNRLVLSSPEQHIFATTVAENLRVASNHPESLTDEEMWQALEKAHLVNWVRNLPNQLETLIGERGSTMSGGQRQRLTLARLFIANPQVWILDEPTEHLDDKLADKVISAVKAQRIGSSLVIASHRLADTADLDHIFKVSRPN